MLKSGIVAPEVPMAVVAADVNATLFVLRQVITPEDVTGAVLAQTYRSVCRRSGVHDRNLASRAQRWTAAAYCRQRPG